VKPKSGAWFLFSAEIAMYPRQVSWLRSGTNLLPVRLLPRPLSRVDLRRTSLRLQWRDRTGIAPDFPFQPLRGTLGLQQLYHAAGEAVGAENRESGLGAAREIVDPPKIASDTVKLEF